MLAIIPARGGSKGLPKKNIRDFDGKPLIFYSIKAAKKSRFIDRIIVSTDDKEIAQISEMYGAEVPFLRPKELATDTSQAIDTYLYTINEINKQSNNLIDEFIVLQPTSPLRREIDINEAISLFREKNADSVISVFEAKHPPNWYKKISNHGILADYFQGENSLNRQEYQKTYLPNGAIFILKYHVLKKTRSYYTEKSFAYIMPAELSIDIDNLWDFQLAELLISLQITKKDLN